MHWQFYDFKKAFDTVNHKRLLQKLYKYGIRGPAWKLFQSYLQNRSQYISIDDKCSDFSIMKHGVPQGSILGPLLFNLYINDLHFYLRAVSLTHYADDTTTLSSHNTLYNLYNNTQQCLDVFQKWAHANLLALNTTKTKYVLFCPRHNECIVPFDLKLDGLSLEKVNSIRYLGLIIDDKLKYDLDIRHVCSRLSRTAGITYTIHSNLTLEAALSLYFSLAQSILSYLLLFWGSTFDSYLENVQVLQNKIIRNLFSQKIVHTNTTDLYYQLNILKIKELFLQELGISMYKAIYLNQYNTLTESMRNLQWSHNYNTRKINAYRLPTVRSSKNARHIIFKGVQYWNSLPLKLRASKSLSKFKRDLKSELLKNYVT